MSGPEDVRKSVKSGLSLPKAAIPGFLGMQYQTLMNMNRSIVVDGQDGLASYYAADLQVSKNLSPQEAQRNAISQIQTNKTTALTTLKDYYVYIRPGNKFDELHELMHICSAPGGVSKLKDFQNKLNEGAINLFSEFAADAAGVDKTDRYPEETKVAYSLLSFLNDGGEEGLQELFRLTFGDNSLDIDNFFAAVCRAFRVKLIKKFPNAAATNTQAPKFGGPPPSNFGGPPPPPGFGGPPPPPGFGGPPPPQMGGVQAQSSKPMPHQLKTLFGKNDAMLKEDIKGYFSNWSIGTWDNLAKQL